MYRKAGHGLGGNCEGCTASSKHGACESTAKPTGGDCGDDAANGERGTSQKAVEVRYGGSEGDASVVMYVRVSSDDHESAIDEGSSAAAVEYDGKERASAQRLTNER